MSTGNRDLFPVWNFPFIELIMDEVVKDTWGGVTYEIPRNENETFRYVQLLKNELSLYPLEYLKKSGAVKIVLGSDLAFHSEYRAAVPDPYKQILYLSINGSFGESGISYLIHVLHHELHHLVEFAAWKNMYFNWIEWNNLNPEGFSYSKTGAGRYHESEPDYYSVTHPLNGFLNLYSMMGGEEDRCELMAFLMSSREKGKLLKYFSGDSILRRKVRFITDFVNNFAGVDFIVFPDAEIKKLP